MSEARYTVREIARYMRTARLAHEASYRPARFSGPGRYLDTPDEAMAAAGVPADLRSLVRSALMIGEVADWATSDAVIGAPGTCELTGGLDCRPCEPGRDPDTGFDTHCDICPRWAPDK